jgi:NADPH-dependent 2,4-dienoyl-CoA reductase/sulfur reductase-like enzyme
MSVHLLRSRNTTGPHRTTYGPRDRIVVVGTGAAGWSAAGELRRLGFTGDLIALGAEPGAPYDRTACSKGLLNGHQRPQDTQLDLRGHPGVRWHTGVRVAGLDPVSRRLVMADGETLAYDGLVVATGTKPSLPKRWPTGPGLHLLHDVSDARALRQALSGARRVAVVGGGLTGCEVACAVTAMARKAVLINSQPYLMPRSVGEPIGTLITASHRAAGLDLRLGEKVADAEHRRSGWRLLLHSGDTVSADVVVVAAGEQPELDWLDGTPTDRSDGLLCDESLRVLGLDGVVAAGALARWPDPRHGTGQPRRVGQWIMAVEQGRAAARTLLAADLPAPPVSLLPRFWSDQNGLRIQVCGRLSDQADVHLTELRPRRRDAARAGVVASYVEGGRLAGVAAVNAPRAFNGACRTLLSEPAAYPTPAPAPVAIPAPEPELRLRLVN